jgi:hypothetical protein
MNPIAGLSAAFAVVKTWPHWQHARFQGDKRVQSYCEQIRESCVMDMAVDRVSLADYRPCELLPGR